MPVEDPNDLDRVDREIRINEMREQLKETADEDIVDFGIEPECSPENAEAFLAGVLAYESAPWTSHFEMLIAAGLDMPEPDRLNDEEIRDRVWEVIDRLAVMRVFLSSTDHLSDRELYALMWHELLRERVKAVAPSPQSACHIDILGACTEEDMMLRMKYYADEDERRDRLEDWPDFDMPSHADLPFDRDAYLPRADLEPGDGSCGDDEVL